jgi:hypothetical protein
MAKISSLQVISGCLLIFFVLAYFAYQYTFHVHRIQSKDVNAASSVLPASSYIVSKSVDYQYRVCAFTTLENGAFLLPQWVDYHTIVGIDQFYLINQCDEDSDKKSAWLSFYESLGLVHQLNYGKVSSNDKCATTSSQADHLNQIYLMAKSDCEWVIPLGVDEYINPGQEGSHPNLPSPSIIGIKKFRSMILNMDMAFLKSLLTNSSSPVYRLPIYTMSNHMNDNHTHSLVIDHYLYGQFSNEDKYLVRSDYIPKLEEAAKASLRKGAKLSLSSLFMTTVQEGELTPISAERSLCLIPSTPLFIKHFHVLSLEDYLKMSSDADKSKQKWLKYYFKRRCPLLNEASRRVLSRKMLELFHKNYQAYCGNRTSSSLPNETRVLKWLSADATIC